MSSAPKYAALEGLPANFKADRVKLICCDIDGTTLDPSHNITQYTLDTFRAVRALRPDLPIIFATGRPRIATRTINGAMEELGHSIGVYSNGALCGSEDSGTPAEHHAPSFHTLHECPIPADDALWYLNWAVTNGRPMVIYTYDCILSPHEHPSFAVTAEADEPYPEKTDVEELIKAIKDGMVVHKLSFMSPKADLDRTRADLDSNPTCPKNTILVRTGDPRLEVMNHRATKAAAIEQLAQTVIKCSMEEIMAFGDGENDIQMLDECGMGVAMGNGEVGVKEVAKFVAPGNGEDGLARVLRAVFGIEA
ncbi:hypothetical protein HDV00_006352 [Rhizophlyctis rosea]|nr:hypothetical protein HDV00_006352 [Rhizophlyctis rosea]